MGEPIKKVIAVMEQLLRLQIDRRVQSSNRLPLKRL